MGTQGKLQNVTFPLSNISYDLLTIIQEKSKALKAYDEYVRDAQADPEVLRLLERIRNEDARHIEELSPHLARCLEGEGAQASGQPRVQQGGSVTQGSPRGAGDGNVRRS